VVCLSCVFKFRGGRILSLHCVLVEVGLQGCTCKLARVVPLDSSLSFFDCTIFYREYLTRYVAYRCAVYLPSDGGL